MFVYSTAVLAASEFPSGVIFKHEKFCKVITRNSFSNTRSVGEFKSRVSQLNFAYIGFAVFTRDLRYQIHVFTRIIF